MWFNQKQILTGKGIRVCRLKGKDGRKEEWREQDEGREVMMKHIVAKRALSCCAAL